MPQFLSTDEIRRRFIAFYVSKEHKHLPADSLVPANDPSVLFTGAGMNQFKDHFLGRAKLEHPRQRAVTVQPCVRTSDIENVGRTPNHHACFEMLGNFSFGDYFKDEAVLFAAEFMLDAQRGLGLEPERLSVTVYGGNPKLKIAKDEEAIAAWKKHAPWLKDPRAPGTWRIYEYGDHDNYWPADAPEQGPNGPSGPCSEIFFDMKPEQGAPEPVAASKDPDRYCEIWNLVFTQFNRVGVGKLEPLPMQNIDTGSGLERVTRVIQGKPNNFEIDLLFPVVQAIAKLAGKEYGKEFETDRRMRRITDHVRFAAFAISSGVQPGRKEREYVLRRLLRRATLDGKEIGISELFMGGVARQVVRQMGVGYPELAKRQEQIVRIIEEEEKAFGRTLRQGESLLIEKLQDVVYLEMVRDPNSSLAGIFPEAMSLIKGENIFFIQGDGVSPVRITSAGFGRTMDEVESKLKRIRELCRNEWLLKKHQIKNCQATLILLGRVAHYLWDTYGFPLEITIEQADQLGITVDRKGFELELEESGKRSQAGSALAKEIFTSGPVQDLKARFAGRPTAFEGYGRISLDGAQVLALVHENKVVESAPGGEALVLLDRTPFYAESGGQVGDVGRFVATGGIVEHRVTQTQKEEGLYFHAVKLGGPLQVGEKLTAIVEDEEHRRPTQRNHSATHLLHLALRKTLGTHVEQRGSLVAPDRLRFDFTHAEALKPEQLAQIESCVNHFVRHDIPVETAEKPLAEAKAQGAMALFGEKYGDRVRVVSMGPSLELCGGTHVARTGEIGYFRIVSEGSVAAGVRRIEALTGEGAVRHARETDATLAALAAALKTKRETLPERIKALQEEKSALERELEAFKKKAASAAGSDLVSGAKDVKGAKLITASLDGLDAVGLRTTLDGIRRKLPEAAVVLGGVRDGKAALLVSLSPELVKRGGHAGNLLKQLAPLVGGKGGGKPELAQGGGPDVAKLPEALAAAEQILQGMLT